MKAESGLFCCDIKDLPERSKCANPICYITPGIPPFYIMHGTKDNLIYPEHGKMLHKALIKEGIQSTFIEEKGYVHSDYRLIPNSRIKGVEKFLDSIKLLSVF